ncbi:hypothetical protein DL764_005814 [Monosporascus ibericus]|uniref:Uncharacterized protein n=1 Tax=Monosporascus ibericus TaxID=155417 RepID=A0A4Q4T7H5_9PEZI|nr:hypothetical protein DL764_005814 [Monosporascus ibericus]
MIDRPERQTWGRPGRPSRARPERPSVRRQERWEPPEEPRGYRGFSVRSATDGRYDGYDYERSGHRYQGDEYERSGHRYQGDDYERGGYRYRDDDYERRGPRRYEEDRDGHPVEIGVSLVHERGPGRRPSPPPYRDPYEDDYARRERSPLRRRSQSRYRGRLEDDYAWGDGYGYARRGRGYGGRSPIRPRSPYLVRPRALPPFPSRAPSLVLPRALSPVPSRVPSLILPRAWPPAPAPPSAPAPPPAPAPPRAPEPRVSGNRVWLTPKPKPAYAPPLPLDRSLIHCENCNRQHDPRLCRGPVSNGRINICARCGSRRHIFEDCWFGDPAVDDVDDFLWHPRQGLAPIATRIDLSDRQAQPGRHVRPVYSRKFAQEQYTLEKTEKMRLGLPYLEKTIDYRSLQPPEFECMNTPVDPSLVGYTRGPPASKNPKPGHAQASVRADANELMPIPRGVAERDANELMPIPTDADMDVDDFMPIPGGSAGGEQFRDSDGTCSTVFGCREHCQTCGFDLERDPNHGQWCPWERRMEADPINKQRPLVVKLTCRRAGEVHPGVVESIAPASLEPVRNQALENAQRDWRARTKWVEEGGNADDWSWSPAHWQLYVECKHCWEVAYESSWESQEPGYGYKAECPIAADLPPNPFKHPGDVRAVLGEQ